MYPATLYSCSCSQFHVLAPAVTDAPSAPGRSFPPVDKAHGLRFIKMLSLTMSDQLRTIALNSIQAYLAFWDRYNFPEGSPDAYLGYPLAERPNFNASAATEIPVNKWGADLYSGDPAPLFRLTLSVGRNGLALEPELPTVAERVLKTFDAFLASVNGIDDVSAKAADYNSDATLLTVGPEDPIAQDARFEIGVTLDANLVAPTALMASFGEFDELVTMDIDAYIAAWEAAEHPLEETAAEIARLEALFHAVAAKSESAVRFKMIVVDVHDAQAALQARAMAARSALQHWVERKLDEANVSIIARFEEIVAKLREDPGDTEAMDALERFVTAVEAEMATVAQRIADSQRIADVLAASEFNLDVAVCDRFYETLFWPAKLGAELAGVKERLTAFRNRYMIQLSADQQQLSADLVTLNGAVEAFVLLGEFRLVDDRLLAAQDIEDKLKLYAQLAELYASRADIFGTPKVEYPQIETIGKRFEPYNTMWRFCGEFSRSLPQWMDGPFNAIDAEELASECDKWWRGSAKLMKTLDGAPQEVHSPAAGYL